MTHAQDDGERKPIDNASEGSEAALNVKRREVLKGAAALSAAALFPTIGNAALNALTGTNLLSRSKKPNILFIIVDEMRFPTQFPAGINSPGEFLQKFMPNTYSLWSKGVKFAKHYSAANDCTPARGSLVTGLYSQQTWCVNTLVYKPGATHADSPPLNPAFPTYGKLLKQAGYQTPYIGKWHLSVPPAPGIGNYLENYGFQGFINPDPTANNLQGTYGDENNDYYNDTYISQQAVSWLNSSAANQGPWCLTVGFQNPHDKQYFPAGTEFQSWTELYTNSMINPNGYQQHNNWSASECGSTVPWSSNALKNPPDYGYPVLPSNWESLQQVARNKPGWQSVAIQVQALIWGGVSFDQKQTNYMMEQYPTLPGQTPSTFGILRAPFNYWQRSLDSYTQIMEVLDVNVGTVLNGMPEALAQNTIVIFVSDHGDYAGSHGIVSGKTGTFYNECANVPLIVHDPTGRYTRDVDTIRTGITSHVDILPMLVSFAHNGRKTWMRGDLAKMYSNRHSLIPMLHSAHAPGRRAAYYATDETITAELNFLLAPEHVLGMVTKTNKVAVYSHWNRDSTNISQNGQQIEYYDYTTPLGRAEVESQPESDEALIMAKKLLNQGLSTEIHKPLPLRYRGAQHFSQKETIAYFKLNEMSLLGD